MTTLAELFASRRWCYWLNQTKPGPDDKTSFQVSVVFENEDGHYPTGTHDKTPWYWNQNTCNYQNEKLGINQEEALAIVASSMGIYPT